MTYPEAIRFLYDLQLFGAKLGLENPRKLAALAGNPQDGLRFIHVAGTNGKGSTCAMLDSVCRGAGLKVGLFTSPHLVEFRERIRINGEMIPEAELVREVTAVQGLLERLPSTNRPTFFEVVVVIALNWFARNGCDLVIWETGLGGRLDATNIVNPLACVIARIGLDHQKWLGGSLPEIAREKAGIIKPGVPVIHDAADPETMEVVCEVAQAEGAPLILVTDADERKPPLADLNLALAGAHQRRNAALVVATARALTDVLTIPDKALIEGLRSARLAGRFQEVEAGGGRKIVLDGAHNECGLDALLTTLQERFPGVNPVFVVGVLSDKNWAAMCAKLAAAAGRMLLAPVSSERSAAPDQLAAVCRAANPAIDVKVCDSTEAALEQMVGEPLTVVTGSLHFLGEVMEALRLSPSPEIDERGLNDYSPA